MSLEATSDTETASSLLNRMGDLGCFRKGSLTTLEFMGRMDRQVNHESYRIELSEIEAVIKCTSFVLDAHVVQAPNPHDQLQSILRACVLPQDADTFTPHDVRQFCKEHFPAYMLPRLIIPLDKIPLSSHGKVNYRPLPLKLCRRLLARHPHPNIQARGLLQTL